MNRCVGGTVFTRITASPNHRFGLSNTLDDFESDVFAVRLIHGGIPLKLNRLSREDNYMYQGVYVTYNGQQYVTNGEPDYGDIVPYNTTVSNGVVNSGCKPTDTNSILVQHDYSINVSDLWTYTNPQTGSQTNYKFSLKQNKWLVTD